MSLPHDSIKTLSIVVEYLSISLIWALVNFLETFEIVCKVIKPMNESSLYIKTFFA